MLFPSSRKPSTTQVLPALPTTNVPTCKNLTLVNTITGISHSLTPRTLAPCCLNRMPAANTNNGNVQPIQPSPAPAQPATALAVDISAHILDGDGLRAILEWCRTQGEPSEPSASKNRAYPWSDKLSVNTDPTLHHNVAKTR